jgi:hypothetical protein
LYLPAFRPVPLLVVGLLSFDGICNMPLGAGGKADFLSFHRLTSAATCVCGQETGDTEN